MLKTVVLCFLFLIVHLNAQSQGFNTDEKLPRLFSAYVQQDTSKILERWKLEKDESIDIHSMLQMQFDVFGKLENPESYQLEEALFSSSKTLNLYMTTDSVFSKDRSAKITLNVCKGKKKKDNYEIQKISVNSKSESLKPFADSLCSQYLELIRTNQSDSLAELVYRTEELKENLEKFKETASRKKSGSADMAYGFMLFSYEIVRDAMRSIDTNEDPSFEKCNLSLKTGDPIVHITYRFQGKDGEDIKCTMSFKRNNETYELDAFNASTGKFGE